MKISKKQFSNFLFKHYFAIISISFFLLWGYSHMRIGLSLQNQIDTISKDVKIIKDSTNAVIKIKRDIEEKIKKDQNLETDKKNSQSLPKDK